MLRFTNVKYRDFQRCSEELAGRLTLIYIYKYNGKGPFFFRMQRGLCKNRQSFELVSVSLREFENAP